MSAATWLLVHLVSAAALSGLAWTVQLVVYPAFALVGPERWTAYHRRHTRAITRAVVVPWAAQGVSTIGLLLRPPGGDLLVPAVLGALALVTVLATVGVAVPAHDRMARGCTDVDLRTLLRSNLVRALAWTASTAVAAALLAAGGWSPPD